MKYLCLTLALLAATLPARAAPYVDDPGMTAALVQVFGIESPVIGSYLFPSDPDPAISAEAIGVVFSEIVGAAGNFNIDVGLFRRQGAGYVLVGPVEVYGVEPRDAEFLPDRVRLTTTTLRDTDARCCPTGTTTWSIDRATLRVTRSDR